MTNICTDQIYNLYGDPIGRCCVGEERQQVDLTRLEHIMLFFSCLSFYSAIFHNYFNVF